ncbi:MAG: HAD domain-containing protein [Prochloraceae cyanobacterium]|nr:HAD domain-containing protein [Prochloraceae cyanobacterium]
MWIFLDIDGVLVPEKKFENSIAQEDFLKFDPTCLQIFEDVLQRYPKVLVGISSSWRDVFPLEVVRTFFSSSIASRIVGFTPLLDTESSEPSQYFRYQEVLEFLRDRNASDDSWIAIDDIRDYYPPNTHVVVTDTYNGFDTSAASALEEYLLATD